MFCRRYRFTRIVFSITAILLVFSYLSPDAFGASDATLRQIRDYLAAAEKVNQFQGAVLVAKAGEIIYSSGYGMANVELNVPNTPEMKFQIGSVTKQFTAAAIMQLVEKGIIKVNDPISKYLPDYPKPNGDKITVRHLLTHTSGTPNFTDFPDLWNRRALPVTMPELIATFASRSLDFEPGTRFKYSNSGYVLLGAIVEKVSGESYEHYLQKQIFDPLEMKTTGCDNRRMILPNRAAGYSFDSSGNIVNAAYMYISDAYGAGVLYSTVGDMLIWDQSLYTGKILSKKSIDEMFTPYLDGYGYGFIIDTVFGKKHIWHNGGIDGFHTTFERWPADSLCVTVLSNNENAKCEMLARGLAAIMYNQPYDIPVKKTPIVLDTVSMKEYAGVFNVDSATFRVISYENGKLYSRRTNGIIGQIFPEGKDKFYYDFDNSITVTFLRDKDGKITGQKMHQMGVDAVDSIVTGPKADSVLAATKEMAVDPAIQVQYAGDYQLAPQFILTISVRGKRVYAQATGQQELEIFPKSDTEYFWKAVDAQVKFTKDADGKVTGLVLHQNGQDMPAKKVK